MRRRALLSVAVLLLGSCMSETPSPATTSLHTVPATGFVPVEGGRLWYEVHGSGARTPLLVLHGGPGIPHDYLANLAELGDERPVVFYDQLGCGRSDRPDDPSLWTRERFVRELATVREALGLTEVVLYGHSWGSILAVDALSGVGAAPASGVKGAILAGPALSIPRWIDDARRLIATLTPAQREAIEVGERTGETQSRAYQDAMQAFYARYVSRADPWPDALNAALAGMGQQVYETMNGPSEFTITGSLRTADVTPQLGALRLPLLFIAGEFDEATPETTRAYAALAPRAEVVVIPGAAHIANYDRPAAYLEALRGWLDRNHL